MKAMSKESEMKVADMKDTLSGFKFLTPKYEKKFNKNNKIIPSNKKISQSISLLDKKIRSESCSQEKICSAEENN